jgi:hypothetical protein
MKRDNPIKYSDLLLELPNSLITYQDLLSTEEWRNFRNNIVKSALFICKCCNKRQTENAWEVNGNGSVGPVYVYRDIFGDAQYTGDHIRLNVHHKYYVKDQLPWEYPESALISVCAICHQKIHENEAIPVYASVLLKDLEDVDYCTICEGSGYRDKYHYYLNGICFHCDGQGFHYKK